MAVATMEARPPYVDFEYRSIEDRTATMEKGHPVFRDVAYVIVTPQGSKDRHECVAEEWLARKQQDVQEQRFPASWLQFYQNQFKAWKANQELPVDGIAIKNWPAVTPAQVKTLLGLNIRTVEDLAEANEETLTRIGMGARALKQTAAHYLAQAAGAGKTSSQLTALEQENADLKARLEKLEQALATQPQGKSIAKDKDDIGAILDKPSGGKKL